MAHLAARCLRPLHVPSAGCKAPRTSPRALRSCPVAWAGAVLEKPVEAAPERPLSVRAAAAADPLPQLASPPPLPDVGAATAAGALRGSPKPRNEDAYLVERLGGGATLVAVCDGHGLSGHLAAQHVSAQLAAAVRSAAGDASGSSDESDGELAPSKQATNLGSPTALAVPPAAALGLSSPAAAKGCLREAFRLVAESVVAAAAAGANACDFAHSGATAVACLVLEDSVVAAWVGDSRAVVGVRGADGGAAYSVHAITLDHKPDKPAEAVRIMAAGGWVAKAKRSAYEGAECPLRVCLPQNRPGVDTFSLSVARAFGDLVLAPAGVVPVPDFSVFRRSAAAAGDSSSPLPAELLIVATDGLWEVVSNEEAVELAAAAGTPEAASQALTSLARQRWQAKFGEGVHIDDVTVVVCYL